MAAPYLTKAQLVARVSQTTVDRVLDDSGSGQADGDAVTQVLADASNFVRAGCGFVFDIDSLVAANPVEAGELIRIGLDVAHAYLADRHPEILKMGTKWVEAKLKRAREELALVRQGKSNVAMPNAPTPDKVGGVVIDCGRRVTLPNADGTGGLGDF